MTPFRFLPDDHRQVTRDLNTTKDLPILVELEKAYQLKKLNENIERLIKAVAR